MKIFKLLPLWFFTLSASAATLVPCGSYGYKPFSCDLGIVGAMVSLASDQSGNLCTPANWSLSQNTVGNTTLITVINGCRGTFNVSAPIPIPSLTPKPSPSPTPSPTYSIMIQMLPDSGNTQAPKTYWFSALPKVPQNCFTDNNSYVGPQKTGATTNVEANPLAIIHNPKQTGDSSWSTALINAVQLCIRNRDTQYNVSTSSGTLQGGSVLGSSYQWDFGDSGSSFNQVPGMSAAHIYSIPGIYTVTLTVKTDNGKTLVGRTTVNVVSSARRSVSISTQSQFDAARNDSNVGGRLIQFARGVQYIQTTVFPLGANDWVTAAPGSGALPILLTNYTSGTPSMFSITSSSNHVQVDSLDIRVKIGTTRPVIAEPLGSGVVFKDIVLSRGSTWNGPGRGWTLYGSGQLLQNIGAPLDGSGNPQSSGLSQNFAYITGDHVALYGNRAYVASVDGNSEPGIRSCGTQVEGLSLSDNIIGGYFGKQSMLSLRGGHNSYIGGNTIYGGVANFQTQCSDAFTPATSNANLLMENNIQKNNTFAVNGDGSYNILYQNNNSHLYAAAQPLGPYQNANNVIINGDSRTGPILLKNNQFLFDLTVGHVYSVGTPNQVTVIGNTITPATAPTGTP